MRKISFYIPYYLKNKIFNSDDQLVNQDGRAYSHFLLKQLFSQKGYDLSTYDINPIDSSEAIIYNDMPKDLPKKENVGKSYLILFESEVIKPDNWDLNRHQFFNKIFTWSDDLVDNKKYFKINFSHLIPESIPKDIKKNKKLCTLIAGNKKVSHPLELYSERVRAIRWFEQHHLDGFDFYGVGWAERSFENKYLNLFFRKTGISKVLANSYPSYGGKVVSKKDTLQQYKFAICYENARDISGYITEKIFDCFFAGCIPIYWGADNVTDHIPPTCFIDRRDFDSYEALYGFMVSMSGDEYLTYLHHIDAFLKSEQVKPFSAKFFANAIVHAVVKDLGS